MPKKKEYDEPEKPRLGISNESNPIIATQGG
jgi:hypothetical protein